MLSYIWIPQENGIFDAIEKHYLRSFIFAIYLVRVKRTFAPMSRQQNFQGPRRSKQVGRKDPVYSFCVCSRTASALSRRTPSTLRLYFLSSLLGQSLTALSQYRRIAGTDVVVPIMSLGEDLEKLTLGDGGRSKDPILLASVEGGLPTFKDVKRSLKVRDNHLELDLRGLQRTIFLDINQNPNSSNISDGRPTE